jgi:MFS transporter, DHA2 family, multidrug resistance protein
MNPAHPDHMEWKPSHNPWLITIAVMIGTFMEVLDTSVANVALPHIAGNLSATNEEATWVLTSYLVSNSIILPATGWLSRYFGRRRLLIVCITIFTVSSLMCGLAQSLGWLVAMRVLQGVGGGALQPSAQAVLLESFPPRRRGAAMAAYALGVVCAPIIGPTLGGWITDNYSWRWIFYINVPVGMVAVFMVNAFVEDPPYIKNAAPGRIDFLGLSLMTLWLATLQIMLDKGQQEDWFAAPWICWFAVISTLAFLAFIWRELTAREPIVDLRVLANRNFAVGTGLVMLVGAVLYASIALLPLFLQTMMGYPALNSGLTLSPRGAASLLVLPFIGRLTGVIDNRKLIFIGFILLGLSTLLLGNLTLEVGMRNIIIPNLVGGMALGFLFVPLTTVSMGTLRQDQIGNASGIYNLMRNIGGSFGISIIVTVLSRDAQSHWAGMAAHLSPFNPLLQQRLQAMHPALAPHFGPLTTYVSEGFIYQNLIRQSLLWAYIDGFRTMGTVCFVCALTVFLFKRVSLHGPAAGH